MGTVNYSPVSTTTGADLLTVQCAAHEAVEVHVMFAREATCPQATPHGGERACTAPHVLHIPIPRAHHRTPTLTCTVAIPCRHQRPLQSNHDAPHYDMTRTIVYQHDEKKWAFSSPCTCVSFMPRPLTAQRRDSREHLSEATRSSMVVTWCAVSLRACPLTRHATKDLTIRRERCAAAAVSYAACCACLARL